MTVEKINEAIKDELKKKRLFSEVSETELIFVENCQELTEEQLGDNTKAWFDGETIIDNVEEIEDGIQQVFSYTKDGNCVNLELYFLNNGGRENDAEKLLQAIRNLEDKEEFSGETEKKEGEESYKSMVENSAASLEANELVDNTEDAEKALADNTREKSTEAEASKKTEETLGCTSEAMDFFSSKIIFNRNFDTLHACEIKEYLMECENSGSEGWMKFKETFSPILIEKHPLGAAAWLLNETDLKHYKSIRTTNPYDSTLLKAIAETAVSIIKANS